MTGNIGRAEREANNIGDECKLFSTDTIPLLKNNEN